MAVEWGSMVSRVDHYDPPPVRPLSFVAIGARLGISPQEASDIFERAVEKFARAFGKVATSHQAPRSRRRLGRASQAYAEEFKEEVRRRYRTSDLSMSAVGREYDIPETYAHKLLAGVEKGRGALTRGQLVKLRELHATGYYMLSELAERFGVSDSTIQYHVGTRKRNSLRAAQKREVRSRYAERRTTMKALAAEFRVSTQTICNAIHGRRANG
jgi:predicted DNA binding protein